MACDYQTICQRDTRLPGFSPRRLEKLSAREVLARLRETDE